MSGGAGPMAPSARGTRCKVLFHFQLSGTSDWTAMRGLASPSGEVNRFSWTECRYGEVRSRLAASTAAVHTKEPLMFASKSDVVVVGAGPVGLACALLLGRQGVSVTLVEGRTELWNHPRAHVVLSRTVELMRGWGIAERIRAAGLPPSLSTGFAGFLTDLGAEEFAVLNYIDDETIARVSPEQLISCPQDAVERVLLATIAAETDVVVEFDRQVVDFQTVDGGVVVETRDSAGATHLVHGRYVVGADGGSSAMRRIAGIEMPCSPPLARRLNIWFEADLSGLTRGRPFMLWMVHNLQAQGIFVALDGRSRWVYSFEVDLTTSKDDYTIDQCKEILRAAFGVREVDPTILGLATWNIDIGVAERFRSGSVFLIGDAAHKFPPYGGYGMNSGIQDAHNLAWKLAAVIKGEAGESLLDTYEIERRPVAEYNAQQSMKNAERSMEAAGRLAAPEVLALLASPDGAGLRAGIAAALAEPSEEIHSLGQQFGQIYSGPGVIGDGSEPRPSTTMDYVATARPGARAPHVRLIDSTVKPVSTLDLIVDRWAVLVAGHGPEWAARARAAEASLGVRAIIHEIHDTGSRAVADGFVTEPGQRAFADVYELAPGDGTIPAGAVLIRPDGFVGARWQDGTSDDDAVTAAIASILSLAGARLESSA
jgi:putative polyketide hydroxylase